MIRIIYQKIRRWSTIPLALMILVGSQGAFASSDFFEPIDPPRAVQIIAHRGNIEQAPENTAEAIEFCINDGIEWAEVDLRRTRDGVHVLLHDAELDRTTNGHGPIKNVDASTVQTLDAGRWFAKRFTGAKLPTLAEALEKAKGRINLYLDIKDADVRSLTDSIRTAKMEKQVVIYGDEALLKAIHIIAGSNIATMTKWQASLGTTTWIDRVRPTAVEIDAPEVTQEVCLAFHKRGIKVEAKTLGVHDQPETWQKMQADGVDWIQTDRPVEALGTLLRARLPILPIRFALHRGASRYAPENTIAAIDRAIRLGGDYIEIDVRTSRDGRFFLQHDATVNRKTSGQGSVRELDSATIRTLDAGSWFGKPFANEQVPTLDQALDHLKGKAKIYFDAKDIAPESLAAILKQRAILNDVVVYQGVGYLKRLKTAAPTALVMPPLKSFDEIDSLVETLHPYAFDTKWTSLSKSLIDHCHAKGVKVFADALGIHETVESYQEAINLGIDLIQTDHPARLFRAFERIESRR